MKIIKIIINIHKCFSLPRVPVRGRVRACVRACVNLVFKFLFTDIKAHKYIVCVNFCNLNHWTKQQYTSVCQTFMKLYRLGI